MRFLDLCEKEVVSVEEGSTSHFGSRFDHSLYLLGDFLAELSHIVTGEFVVFLASLLKHHIVFYVCDIVLQSLDLSLGIALLHGIE